jgi:hypothetical protein
MTTWSPMTAETANKWLGRARHDARPGSRGHRPVAEKRSSDEGGGPGDDPRSCFLVTGAGPLRLGQGLGSCALLAGTVLLLSHRDHEPFLRGLRRRIDDGAGDAVSRWSETNSVNRFVNRTLRDRLRWGRRGRTNTASRRRFAEVSVGARDGPRRQRQTS